MTTSSDPNPKIIRATRDKEPMHLTFRIEAYEELVELIEAAEGKDKSIVSTQFSDGGNHSWALVIYPKGNGAQGYISLYVKLLDKLRGGKCIHASFKFFILNNRTEKYITFQDGRARSFHAGRRECGISNAISQVEFFDDSKGMLIAGCCTFGVEVYAVNQGPRTSRLSMMETQTVRSFPWPIYDLSTVRPSADSPNFPIENRSWKLQVFPRGNLTGASKFLSLYVFLNDRADLDGGKKLYVEVELTLKDQLTGDDRKKTVGVWFDSDKDHGGLDQFLELAELNNPTKGYRLDDRVVIEATINRMFMLHII